MPPEDYKEEPAKHYPNSATAVLLPLLPEKAYTAEVLIIGGGGINVHLHWNFHHVDACDNCFRMQVDPPLNPEIKEIKPQWQKIKMPNKRVMPDAVLLPDGTVLVVNGTSKGFAGGDAGTGPMQSSDAVKGVDLYNSLTNTWYSLATTDIPRLYHSTALLLPDATVLIAGSDHQSRDTTLAYEYRIEVFEPPYLFIGAERATRPVIKTDKNSVMYKQQFQIEVDGLTDMRREDLRIALLRPGSVTHSNNMSQRYVGLSIVDQSQTHLTLEAPPNGNIAPPGYYMLFLLHGRVPSEAQFIQLLPGTSTEPTDNLPSTTGMEIWLRADVGIGAVNNGSVFSWSDTSGKGNDVFLKKNVGVGEPIQQPPSGYTTN